MRESDKPLDPLLLDWLVLGVRRMARVVTLLDRWAKRLVRSLLLAKVMETCFNKPLRLSWALNNS
jgi:hypothetical protein